MVDNSFLSASIPTLLIVSALSFLVASGMQPINSSLSRKTTLFIRLIGFFLLAISTISPILSFINDFTTAIITVISALLIAFSYILQRLQSYQSEEISTPTTTPKKLNTKIFPPTKNINNPEEPSYSTSSSPTPDTKDQKRLTNNQKRLKTNNAQPQTTRQAIKEDTGLRAEPLIHLPAQRRKKARTLVNTLIGFLVFFLIGWGSYAIAKRVIKPQETPNFITPQINEQETPSHDNDIQLAPIIEETNPVVEEMSEEKPETQEEPVETSKTMLTIKDTETGFLNVREGSNTATSIIAKVDPGDSYEFLDENSTSTWYKIQVDDNTAGWISAKYADKKE